MVLDLLALIDHLLVQVALELDGLFLLDLSQGDLAFVLHLLSNHCFFLKLDLAHVPLNFLLPLKLLMMLLLVVDLPRLFLLFLSFFDALHGQILLLLDVSEQLVAIELLQLRRHV